MTHMQRIPIGTYYRQQQDMTVAGWFFEVDPRQHPFWRHYDLWLISLADRDGVPPAIKIDPQVTHELLLVALDPALRPQYDDLRTHRQLHPVNYVHQLVASDDESAISIAQAFAGYLTSGRALFEIQGIIGGKALNDQCVLRAVREHGSI